MAEVVLAACCTDCTLVIYHLHTSLFFVFHIIVPRKMSSLSFSPITSTSAKAIIGVVALLATIQACVAVTQNNTVEAPVSFLAALTPQYDFGTDNPYRVFNRWINSFLFSDQFVEKIEKLVESEDIGYYLVCYFRDWIAGTAVYWVTGSVWHFYIYSVYGYEIFTEKGRPFPSWDTLKDQMIMAQWAIFIYAALPVLSEFIIESGYTKTYFYISDVGGWQNYFMYLFAYVCCFEMGIYWMHRKLHTVKFLYKWLHSTHHKYNKAETMTPWCSIAFNPFDGILQAAPYLLFLPVIPVHYFTHIFLLFFSGVWATNIHDSVVSKFKATNVEVHVGRVYNIV
jgi:lathosterol oxidase